MPKWTASWQMRSPRSFFLQTNMESKVCKFMTNEQQWIWKFATQFGNSNLEKTVQILKINKEILRLFLRTTIGFWFAIGLEFLLLSKSKHAYIFPFFLQNPVFETIFSLSRRFSREIVLKVIANTELLVLQLSNIACKTRTLKFRLPKKATKIWRNLPLDLNCTK